MLRYIPHPLHQLIPASILLITAVVSGLFPSWQMGLTFVAVLVICTVTGVSIAGAIKSEKEREYWDTIGEDVKLLKDSNPDIWYALGFSNPPGSVTLGKNVTGDEGESDIYAWKNYTFSLSPT